MKDLLCYSLYAFQLYLHQTNLFLSYQIMFYTIPIVKSQNTIIFHLNLVTIFILYFFQMCHYCARLSFLFLFVFDFYVIVVISVVFQFIIVVYLCLWCWISWLLWLCLHKSCLVLLLF